MTPLRNALVSIFAALLLTSCSIPSPPTPPSMPIPSNVYLSLGGASVIVDGVRAEGRLADKGRSVMIQIYNESRMDAELLLDEWMLTADGETSKIFLGTTLRHRIGKRPLEAVEVPPGELLMMTIGMASRHKDKKPFKGVERITLTFVFMMDNARRTGALEVPLPALEPI